MPQVPRANWGQYTDPESQEYNPTKEELKKELSEDDLKRIFSSQLSKIEQELRYAAAKLARGENLPIEYNPEYFIDELTYIENDIYTEVNDPEIKEYLDSKILDLRGKIQTQLLN